jgi:hypothetical protein
VRLCLSQLAATTIILLAVALEGTSANAHKYTEIDVAGAVGTFPLDINENNDITGDFTDKSRIHGFIRTSDGVITTFDVPTAVHTYPAEINDKRVVVGSFNDGTTYHGFVRDAVGAIVTFDGPDATATYPTAINNKGQITGNFSDSSGVLRGFLRSTNGKFTVFDPVGSLETNGESINAKGALTGFYCTEKFCTTRNGFVRTPDGTITTFSVPDADVTSGVTINSKGAVAGRYSGTLSGPGGFLRAADGQLTTFTDCLEISGMNRGGWVVGTNSDFFSVYHGCVRKPSGSVLTFDEPDAGNDIDSGTQPTDINDARYVTGYYRDSNDIYHGFIVRPVKKRAKSVRALH